MSDVLLSLPHLLSGPRRYCTAGYASPRPVILRMPQLPRILGSSHAALVLATKLISPLHTSDRPTTRSPRLTNAGGVTHKSP